MTTNIQSAEAKINCMECPDGTRACSGGGKFTGQFEGVPGGGGGHSERTPEGDQSTSGGGGGKDLEEQIGEDIESGRCTFHAEGPEGPECVGEENRP